jgi:hypothetical protein
MKNSHQARLYEVGDEEVRVKKKTDPLISSGDSRECVWLMVKQIKHFRKQALCDAVIS